MERIVPIYDESQLALKPASEKTFSRGTLADLLVCILAVLAAVLALGYSSLFFIRFLENDTHLWGVLSAFVLCFGVGAFGYVPAIILSKIGWRAHKKGRIARDLIWALFITLPWVLLSAVMVFVSDLSKIYSIPLLILAALFSIWAMISLRREA